MRWIVRIALVLAGVGALAYVFRVEIALRLPRLVAAWQQPIGPYAPVAWEAGPARADAPPDARPPNIVVLLADDLGWNDVSLHGGVAGGAVPTPAIDALAHEGVRFTHGYAGNAVCAPSRAMLLTGRYSTRFGFEFTPAPRGMALLAGLFEYPPGTLRRAEVDRERARAMPAMTELGMPASEITLAEALRERGYHTVHIGKWHLGRGRGSSPNDQGFDESLLMANGLYLPADHPDVVNARQPFDPIDVFLWANLRFAASFNGGALFEPGGYLTDWWTEEAVRVIEANRNRPFFLYLAHWAPHTPLQATRADYDALAHVEGHRERVYGAMVRALDRSVARVMEALEAHGLAGNTLVFFTSDNGGAGYVGLPDLNAPYRGWKLTHFEGGLRVPFAARWPARIPAGTRYDAPVSHLDVFATALAAAGGAPPADRVVDGVDLLPHVLGQAAGEPHEALFWSQGYYRSVLADGWKLQVSGKLDRAWLFHLASDPTEQTDLSAARPEKVRALRARLDAHRAEQAPPAWPSFVDVPVSVDKTLAEPQSPDDAFVWWPN